MKKKQKIFTNKIFNQKNIFFIGIFFAFLISFIPSYSQASVLPEGDITTCGELMVPGGIYNLKNSVSSSGTSTCFTIGADNIRINGGGFTITGTGDVAIDARSRDGGPTGALNEGSDSYTNLVVYDLNISGFTTGINVSGNDDTSGNGIKSGMGGDAGDISIYYSIVGSVLSNGGRSTTYSTGGGVGRKITITDTDLNISNSTLSALGGLGSGGSRNTNGGLELNYTGSSTKTNVVLSAFSYFNDNTTAYGVYAGGTWPMLAGSISTCGTLYAATTSVFTLSQNITNIVGSCFTLSGDNITIDGGGYSLTSATTTNTSFAINAGSYSNFTLASTTVTSFSNLITSSSSVAISGNNVNLSNKYIAAGSLTITYTGTLTRVNTTISALTALVVNGTSHGAQLAGILLDWIAQISSGSRSWNTITSDASGTKLAAVAYNGYIYTSNDSGVTWIERTGSGSRLWRSITSSADGTKLAAVAYSGYIYTSTDSGATWTAQTNAGSRAWYSITSSADGTKLAAVVENGYIYTSTDSGATWTQRDSSRNWKFITSDASGTKLAAVVYGGYIYTSTDSGATWVQKTSDTTRLWLSITSSADGTKLAAVVYSGYIYTSTDSGATWVQKTSDTTRAWYSITSSADGTKLAAGVNSGYIYTSTDSGATWDQKDSSRSRYSITSSADGTKLAAGGSGYIYTHEDQAPTLKVDILTPRAGTATSWPPIISWGSSVSCYYSYNNWTSTSTATCSDNGSDIPQPDFGQETTLYIRGVDANNNIAEKSLTITFNLPVNIINPSSGSTVTYWNPSIDWDPFDAGNISTCQYSYNNFTSTSTADCSLNGVDVLPPTTSGANTLNIRVVDSNANIGTNNVSFTYVTATSSISIIRPASGSSISVGGWLPLINWATSSVACYYSYNNWTSTSTATCSKNGSDILAPSTEGSNTLYIKGVDGLNVTTSTSTLFTYAPWVQATSDAARHWRSITSSADGTKLAAVVTNGYIYTSTDSGTTWTQRDFSKNWYSITSSADGTKLAAVPYGGYIYTSTDSGATWTTNSNSSGLRNWYSITSSADGTKLAAVVQSGYIYTSTDSGATWVQRTSDTTRNWYSITSSADGTKLVAGVSGGYIYTSTDSGATWTAQTNAGSRTWISITSSADGTKLAAVPYGGYIYTSTDSGATWTEQTNSGARYWRSITSSADGTKLAAVVYGGYLYSSVNSGATWTQRDSVRDWMSVTSSADGNKIAANVISGYIYTHTFTRTLKVDILKPTTSGVSDWHPIVSWGSAISCYYSYNNFVSTSTATCANNGSDISDVSFGTSTLYVKGIDASNTVVTASTTFERKLPITITSPTTGTSTSVWSPSVNWNADNLATSSLSCYYSYDNFSTEYLASCASGGIDIPAPSEGTSTLSVKVDDNSGHINTTSVAFTLSYWIQQTTSGARNWYSITSSADGTKLAAVNYGGYIYTSTDSGATWVQKTSDSTRLWLSITSDASGTKLAAVFSGGYIYTSTDSGATWTQRDSARAWQSITSDASGTKLAAVVYNGYIYTSTDSGATWTEQTNAGSRAWLSITSDASGTKLAAVVVNGYIYTSTDSGATWTERTNSGSRNWKSIASSADGTKLAAVVNSGYIYTSTDSGATWTQRDSSRSWYSITSSADGTKLAAIVSGGYIYTSTNSGATWAQKTSDTTRSWYSIISSADGTKLAAVVTGGYIYTNSQQSTSAPKVNILIPFNNNTITTWTPYVSWGTATTTCEYSWNNSDWTSTSCSLNGSNISTPASYGTSTLYVRGTDSNNVTATSSSTFYKNLPISIISPTSGTSTSVWAPSVNWNANNLATSSLSCYYSYDNFSTEYSASCGSAGSDIAAPSEGTSTLSVKVDDNNGHINTTSVSFTLNYWIQQTTSGSRYWNSIASDASGTKLAAVVSNGYIYTSTDSGATWTQRDSSRNWQSITSSADGTKLVAGVANGYIYTSTDSGATWTAQTNSGSRNWKSITSSADGTKLAAGIYDGYIYTSVDSGATWAQKTSDTIRKWWSIASSADGTKLAAVVNSGYIYTSTDSGATWVQKTSDTTRLWRSITSSADGTKLVAGHYNGYIYTSIDSGATWSTNTNSSGSRAWYSITSSADGTKLAASVFNGYIYTSTDSGATWVQKTSDTTRVWKTITSSADGTKLAAVVDAGYVYTYENPNPILKVDILEPLNLKTVLTWNPFISYGSASTCEYSWNNSTWATTTCAGHGSTITAPSYGTSTLYVRGTDALATTVNASSTFNRGLSLVINSPTAGDNRSWSPSVNWNADNLATSSLSCYYSYDNFSTEYLASCASGGTDIPAPSEGTSTLSVKVDDNIGHITIVSTSFNLTYWIQATSDSLRNWISIASSADGTKLAAVNSGGYIYTSTDSGATWTQRDSSRNWKTITSSADGTKLAVIVQGGYIYTSTDSGATWTVQTNSGARDWFSITSSADGTKLAAGAVNGYIYTSTDSGATWTAQTNSGARYWFSITSDASGTKLAAVVVNGYIYTSTDSGTTWTQKTSDTTRSWYSITSSADGTKLAAVDGTDGYIYTSTDSGATWTEQTNSGARDWFSITSSADGTKLAAVVYNGYIYTSTDSGVTWNQRETSKDWQSITSSADGNKLVAGQSSGYLWAYSNPNPDTKVDILTPTNGSTLTSSWNPIISWGIATTTCEYSWNNSDWNPLACSNNGSDIPMPASYGTSTLYIRGTDALSVQATNQSEFNKGLPISIVSPTGGVLQSWTPNVIWDADNLGGLTCSYSYDNFSTEYPTDCSLSGSDIPAPGTEGGNTLYVKVTDGVNTSTASVGFTTGWLQSTTDTTRSWGLITSSADGTKLVAAESYGNIYYSTDGGESWTPSNSNYTSWSSITSSADGTKLAAVDSGSGYIYISTDSGATWNLSNVSYSTWYKVDSSADGMRLVAANGDDCYLYTSSDAGVNWSQLANQPNNSNCGDSGSALSISDDGEKIFSVSSGSSYIDISTDFGQSWNSNDIGTSGNWYDIDSSSDGLVVALVMNNGSIYISNNYGQSYSWSTYNSPYGYWYDVTVSADGSRIAGVQYDGYVYTSSDWSNNNWVQSTTDTTRYWNGIASSKDGNKLFAVVNSGYIYKHSSIPPNFKVDILSPSGNQTLTTSWRGAPVSWGNSVTCEYSWDNSSWSSVNCANAGNDIPAPSVYGSVNLYVRGTDGLSAQATDSVSFTRSVPLNIISPAGGTLRSWSPNINWNPDNVATSSLTCYYSYSSSGSTEFSADCNGTGADINPPNSDGDNTLYLTVYNSDAGQSGYAEASFTSGWIEDQNNYGNWQAFASSADGSKIFAVQSSGYIYYSTNGGQDWNYNDGYYGSWQSITSSSDGTKLAAVNTSGYIYTSTDGGQSWTQNYSTSGNWWSITSDASGTKLAATVYGGYIYTSTDSGATWVQKTSDTTRAWQSITSSADGTKLAATYWSGYIYTSTDSGATWTEQTNSGARYWQSITSSANGTKLAAVVSNGYIYTSTDSGVTWTEQTNSGSGQWRSITSSADGTKLAAVAYNGYIYTSTDSGSSWNYDSNTYGAWYGIASSADGSRLITGGNSGYLWIFSSVQARTVSVDILIPTDNGTISSWNPIVSFGSATTCEYSWNNSDWATTTCSNLGSDIPAPSGYGGFTLYARGTDSNNNTTTKYSTFIRNLPITISSPTSGIVRSWEPSVIWNADQLATSSLSCYYSYDNFSTEYSASCASAGSDIPAPDTDGANTLYVKVDDGNGYPGITSVAFTSGWVQSTFDATRSWRSITSDASGTKLAAVEANGYIYTSTDGGQNWNQSNSPYVTWTSITSSADGTKLAAVVNGGYIYTSTDSGATWVQKTSDTTRSWYSITSDASGTKLAAVDNGGYTYTSTDSGATWSTNSNSSGSRQWYSITSSADGTKLAAVNYGGYIYTSTDSGATWSTNSDSSGSRNWRSITSDASGTKLAVVVQSGYIYTSVDSGVTWTEQTNPGSRTWWSITSDASGTKLAAVDWGGYIYTSTDSGATWTEQTSSGSRDWQSITSSADGTKLATVVYNGYLYTYVNLDRELKVDVLTPLNNTVIAGWNPYISYGSASTCEYSWNDSDWATTTCSGAGVNIEEPSFGTSTLYVRGTDIYSNVVNSSSTFNYIHYTWCGAEDSDWNNDLNWYTDDTCTINTPGLPYSGVSTSLVGTTSPVVDLNDWVKPLSIDSTGLTESANTSGVIFTSTGVPITSLTSTTITGNATFNNYSNNDSIINGEVIFNDYSYNRGTVVGTSTYNGNSYIASDGVNTGNIILNTTYYGSLPTSSAMTISSNGLSGSVSGNILASDGTTPITEFNFSGSVYNEMNINGNATFSGTSQNYATINGNVTFADSTNNSSGTINGNATFSNNRAFSMGTINGTSTLAGINQIVAGGNVTNFFKQASVRETLYITSGFNVSGLFTLRGVDVDNLLSVRSTNPNAYAYLGINSTTSIDFLRLQGIYKNGGSVLDVSSLNVYDDGSNVRITFRSGAAPSQRGGSTIVITPPSIPTSHIPVVTPPSTPSTPANNRPASTGGSFFSGFNLGNLGRLNLGNLPKVNLGNIGSNLGVSKFVNPLAGMLQLAPISGFSPIPRLNIAGKMDNFLNNSLPKPLVDLSNTVPSIKKELSTANIRNGYDLYTMKESPINTPTITELTQDKTKQPESLIFISVDGKERETKLSIDKKGSIYQMITVEPYASLSVSVKNTNKVIPTVIWNGVKTKVTKDKQNIIKFSLTAPKDNGVYILKVGTLTLNVEVKRPEVVVPPTNAKEPKKLSPIQKLWSWFGK